jgi:hypothetical protein
MTHPTTMSAWCSKSSGKSPIERKTPYLEVVATHSDKKQGGIRKRFATFKEGIPKLIDGRAHMPTLEREKERERERARALASRFLLHTRK